MGRGWQRVRRFRNGIRREHVRPQTALCDQSGSSNNWTWALKSAPSADCRRSRRLDSRIRRHGTRCLHKHRFRSSAGATRVARTVTGRDKIAVFAGAYHGVFDEVFSRPLTVNGETAHRIR